MEKKENLQKNKKNASVNNKKGNAAKKVSNNNYKKNENKKNDISNQIEKVKEEVPKKEYEKKDTVKMNKPNTYSESDVEAGKEIRKLLIIIGAVCAVMLSFYFITEFVVKNKKDKEDKKEVATIEPEIQYVQILMGNLFDQNEDDYYVLAYLEDDKMLSNYNNYIKTYEQMEGHAKFYKVNLSDDFNKAYISDSAFVEGKDIKKIKVTGTTLVRIKNHEVYTSYLDSDAITGKFQRLTQTN